MGVLVDDNNEIATCLCGHLVKIHRGGNGKCLRQGCDCVKFAESLEDLAEIVKNEPTDVEAYNEALLVTAQAAIIAEIRWLHSNGFKEYRVIQQDDTLMLDVQLPETVEYIADLDERGYIAGLKRFNITERRKQDRRLESSNVTLEGFAKSGLLPQIVTEHGLDGEPIQEVIICDSISGGADYVDHVPRRLSLVLRFASGTEHRAEYLFSHKLQHRGNSNNALRVNGRPNEKDRV